MCSLGQHFIDIKGSKYMLVHSLASKYARFVVLGRLMYWTPHQTIGPPLLKSDDLFLGNQEIFDPPSKNPGHAPALINYKTSRVLLLIQDCYYAKFWRHIYLSKMGVTN